MRHLVELHGGKIRVASAGENRGAVFTVNLPTADSRTPDFGVEPEPVKTSKIMETHSTTPSLKVLLVEDDQDSQEMLKVMFEQNGIEVRLADSAGEALEIIEKFQPHVLISDIGLPNENGYELIAKIRRLSPAQGGLTPAIALTGYVSPQDRDRAFQVGYQKHLSKPVDIDELLELVKELAEN